MGQTYAIIKYPTRLSLELSSTSFVMTIWPRTDPNFPLAAEMPWQVHRYRVGKASAGIFLVRQRWPSVTGEFKLTIKVVVLGPISVTVSRLWWVKKRVAQGY